jgi:hypothetical protein
MVFDDFYPKLNQESIIYKKINLSNTFEFTAYPNIRPYPVHIGQPFFEHVLD